MSSISKTHQAILFTTRQKCVIMTKRLLKALPVTNTETNKLSPWPVWKWPKQIVPSDAVKTTSTRWLEKIINMKILVSKTCWLKSDKCAIFSMVASIQLLSPSILGFWLEWGCIFWIQMCVANYPRQTVFYNVPKIPCPNFSLVLATQPGDTDELKLDWQNGGLLSSSDEIVRAKEQSGVTSCVTTDPQYWLGNETASGKLLIRTNQKRLFTYYKHTRGTAFSMCTDSEGSENFLWIASTLSSSRFFKWKLK